LTIAVVAGIVGYGVLGSRAPRASALQSQGDAGTDASPSAAV